MNKYIQMLKYERTDYGKQIRKQYESHKVYCRRNEMRIRVPRSDDISNTISTVEKDTEMIEMSLNNADAHRKIREEDVRIRKLTPKECFRLQGFTDEDCDTARAAMNEAFYNGRDRSSSQLYKQAGNSITVDVLYYIFLNLYKAMPYLFEDIKLGSFFSGIGAYESALDRLFSNINNCNVIRNESEVNFQ